MTGLLFSSFYKPQINLYLILISLINQNKVVNKKTNILLIKLQKSISDLKTLVLHSWADIILSLNKTKKQKQQQNENETEFQNIFSSENFNVMYLFIYCSDSIREELDVRRLKQVKYLLKCCFLRYHGDVLSLLCFRVHNVKRQISNWFTSSSHKWD